MFSYSLEASDVSVLTDADVFHLRGALERDRDRLERDLASLDEVSASVVAPAMSIRKRSTRSWLALMRHARS